MNGRVMVTCWMPCHQQTMRIINLFTPKSSSCSASSYRSATGDDRWTLSKRPHSTHPSCKQQVLSLSLSLSLCVYINIYIRYTYLHIPYAYSVYILYIYMYIHINNIHVDIHTLCICDIQLHAYACGRCYHASNWARLYVGNGPRSSRPKKP